MSNPRSHRNDLIPTYASRDVAGHCNYINMKVVLFTFLLFISLSTYGQKTKFEYGFVFGLNKNNHDLTTTDSSIFSDIKSVNKWGFELGFIFQWINNKNLSFRFSPTVSFEEEEYVFYYSNGQESLLFQPTYLRLPFHLLITPIKDHFYILGGISSNVFVQKGQDDPTEKLFLKSTDFSFDIGLGYPIIIKSMRISPEFKYSMGLNNVLKSNDSIYESGISSLKRNTFRITLYVSGN